MARLIRLDGDAAIIPLTRGHEAIIDAADVWLVERWSWFLLIDGKGAQPYAGRATALHGRKYTVQLHRWLVSAPQGFDVDHKDGNGLNCRRANLRLCTSAQNTQNSKVSSRNRSGAKGVTTLPTGFVAEIQVRGVRRYLGHFKTVEAASAAYDAAAREAYGEFAYSAPQRAPRGRVAPP